MCVCIKIASRSPVKNQDMKHFMAFYALKRLMIHYILFLFSVNQKNPQGIEEQVYRNEYYLDEVNKSWLVGCWVEVWCFYFFLCAFEYTRLNQMKIKESGTKGDLET